MSTKVLTVTQQAKDARHKKIKKDKSSGWVFTSGTNFDKMASAKTGITKDLLVSFKQVINIDYDHLSAILGTTKTTLHKKQGAEVFSPSISEKAIALMDLYKYGYEVFEDHDKFNKWIQLNNRALGNRIPLEIMDTIFGIDEVKSIISRIEHGVYS
jgi:putative toxin-antitoxin system antitoxin component (TIGR02293 family)